MSSNNDFRPGLEGVVAVETEIMEPDREGGMLRYRGVDVEPLIGKVPYENVWGLLVDNDINSKMPDPEPHEPVGLTGNAPADLQAETARLSGEWKLGKLNEISDEQAREDLGRLSSQMMSIVARSARLADGKTDAVPDEVVARGKTAAEKFLLRWRGEADPRHVKAIDTYWICTAEHGLNASTFTARVVASTGADAGAALSAGVGALSGPLHGGAPAYVKPMLEEVARMGDPERWVKETLDQGKRIMGFGHRVYRAEDPRSRILKRTAKELGAPQIEVAEELEGVALAALQKRSPDRVLATNVEYYSAIVLDVAEIPPPLAPAMFACSRVAGWSAHIMEQKKTGRLFRPIGAQYVGPGANEYVELKTLRLPPMELTEYRERFPILRDTTYLINHSLGAMPAAAEDRVLEFTRMWRERGIRAWGEGWWEMSMTVGDQIGRIIGAPPGSTVMHQNVAVAEAIVLSCFRPVDPHRNRVVYEEGNFPSVRYLYQAQPELDVVVVHDDQAIVDAIDERTLLVPITHVLFKTGEIQDVEAIIRRAHEVGAHVVLDAYQSAGIVPLDVTALERGLRGRRQREVALRRAGKRLALRPSRSGGACSSRRSSAGRLMRGRSASSPSSSTPTARRVSSPARRTCLRSTRRPRATT